LKEITFKEKALYLGEESQIMEELQTCHNCGKDLGKDLRLIYENEFRHMIPVCSECIRSIVPNGKTIYVFKKSCLETGGSVGGKLISKGGKIIDISPSSKFSEFTGPLTEERVDIIAKAFKELSGKWMLFPTDFEIKSIWDILLSAFLDQLVFDGMKTWKQEPYKTHLICIYNGNFLDEDQIRKNLESLRNLGIKKDLFYKPDVYTSLFIYGSTKSFPEFRYSSIRGEKSYLKVK
jgi:hypothetical protein